MRTYMLSIGLAAVFLALLVTSCTDNPFDANEPVAMELDAEQAMAAQRGATHRDANQVRGRTVQNIRFGDAESGMFSGRITDVHFQELSPFGHRVGTSGKVVGWVTDRQGNRHHINEEVGWFLVFEPFPVADTPPYWIYLQAYPYGGLFSEALGHLDINTSLDIVAYIEGRGPSQALARELQDVLTGPPGY